MNCQTCEILLAAYKHTISLYTTSALEIKTHDGDGFDVPYPKTQLLRQARRYRQEACMACDALVAHWREDHNGPTANGSGPVSREAEQLRQLRRMQMMF